MYSMIDRIIKHATHAGKVPFFILGILLLCLCSGCMPQESSVVLSEESESVSPLPTQELTPSITPSPSPEVTPATLSSNEEEISSDTALTLLSDYEKGKGFTFTLVSDHIVLSDNTYFSFLASKDSIPLEPLILVNKKNGQFSCLSKEGSLISFSTFPLVEETLSTDWSGTYSLCDSNGSLSAVLTISKTDASSFLFYLKSALSDKPFDLSGIAHISGNTANFINDAKEELFFIYDTELKTVQLFDGRFIIPEAFEAPEAFLYTDSSTRYDSCITAENAKESVLSLSTEQTGLLKEITEYTLTTNPDVLVVHDRLCYQITASYKERVIEITAGSFYVTLDGSLIYVYTGTYGEAVTTIHIPR